MGSNQASVFLKKSIFVRVKKPNVGSLKALGQLMKKSQRRTFSNRYGNILDLVEIDVPEEAIVALVQYYDPPLRCFTFRDFQMAPTLEEFEQILGCSLDKKKVYLCSGHYPALAKVATILRVQEQELIGRRQNRNGTEGFSKSYLEDRARSLAATEDWEVFMDALALILYGMILFPNIDGFIDFTAIDAFLAFKNRGESPVVAVLADVYYTLNFSYEKRGKRILCCLPALYVWMVTHIFSHGCKTVCPIEDFYMCRNNVNVEWSFHLASLDEKTVRWYPKWREVEEMIWQCGDFPNVPLMGTKGCINYNPILAQRQFGHPIHALPSKSALTHLVLYSMGPGSVEMLEKIRLAWKKIIKKGKEIGAKSHDTQGSYCQGLRYRVQEVKLPSQNVSSITEEERMESQAKGEEIKELKTVLGKMEAEKRRLQKEMKGLRKECEKLQQENIFKAQSFEKRAKRARLEEESKQKYQSSLKGASNELRLRGQERSRVMAENRRLKGMLRTIKMAHENEQEQLEEARQSLEKIVKEYEERIMKEGQELATVYQDTLRKEQGKVREKEKELEDKQAVIQDLHDQGVLWRHQFATTLRGGQHLPRLLDKAQCVGDPFSTPPEIRDLFEYCEHMIELMKEIIRRR